MQECKKLPCIKFMKKILCFRTNFFCKILQLLNNNLLDDWRPKVAFDKLNFSLIIPLQYISQYLLQVKRVLTTRNNKTTSKAAHSVVCFSSFINKIQLVTTWWRYRKNKSSDGDLKLKIWCLIVQMMMNSFGVQFFDLSAHCKSQSHIFIIAVEVSCCNGELADQQLMNKSQPREASNYIIQLNAWLSGKFSKVASVFSEISESFHLQCRDVYNRVNFACKCQGRSENFCIQMLQISTKNISLVWKIWV